jgi:hypothetical protein
MATVKFYKSRVKLQLQDKKRDIIKQAALRIRERAGINVVNNNQIDTGAMANAFYVVLPDEDTYGDAANEAETRNPGQTGNKISLQHDALVANAMEYAIEQEMVQSFLFKAAEDTAKEFDGVIRA